MDIPGKKLSNGVEIPVLGLGTWQLTGDACVKMVSKALEMGYRHFDTAEMYGNEEEIRDGIEGFDRGELFIASKVWQSNLGYDKTLRACEGSLRRLGTDYLDLYMIHWPDSTMDMKGTFKAFKELVDGGRIRYAGVSNFTVKHLEQNLPACEELGLDVTLNQVEFHPGLYQRRLLEYCVGKDVVVESYSPLARGDVMDNPTLKEIGEKHGKSPAQVSLRWLLQKDTVVIPKSSSVEHASEDMKVFDFELSEDEMERIDSIGDGGRIIVPPFAEFER